MNSIKYLIDLLPASYKVAFAQRWLREASESASASDIDRIIGHVENSLLNLEDRKRRLNTPVGNVLNWIHDDSVPCLEYQVMSTSPPWHKFHPDRIAMPGMLADEETQYYHFIAQYYSGCGEVVELGPWLGLSTRHLMTALKKNGHFGNHKLHVYDDFVWRSDWMDCHYEAENCPKQHANFRWLFEEYTQDIKELLETHEGKFADYDGNEHLPVVAWNDMPIEMIIVDCGRTMKANQGWFDIFSKSFIPNKTLIVMQDWRLHRIRPRVAYNQTLEFTQMIPRMELIHEVSDGGIATFLYR